MYCQKFAWRAKKTIVQNIHVENTNSDISEDAAKTDVAYM